MAMSALVHVVAWICMSLPAAAAILKPGSSGHPRPYIVCTTCFRSAEAAGTGWKNITFFHQGSTYDCAGAEDWDMSEATDLSGCFAMSRVTDLDLSKWDVSSVTDMSGMFSSIPIAPVNFGNIDGWDVSKVTDFSEMFNQCGWDKMTNLPVPGACDVGNLRTWSPVSATNMKGMFQFSSFNGDGPRTWTTSTSSVTDMSSMFLMAAEFNQPLNFDVSKVTTMNSMFEGASKFNGIPNNGAEGQTRPWDVSSVTDMSEMFKDAKAYTGGEALTYWDVSSVTDMSSMFKNAVEFTGFGDESVTYLDDPKTNDDGLSLPTANSNYGIAMWEPKACTDFSNMFYGAEKFGANIQKWYDHMPSTIDSEKAFDDIFTGTSSLSIQFCWGDYVRERGAFERSCTSIGTITKCQEGTDYLAFGEILPFGQNRACAEWEPSAATTHTILFTLVFTLAMVLLAA